jgi:PncC family amidohydrolase
MAFSDLVKQAEPIGARLKERGETIAVAESSTGGLLSAALLAVPGASAYFASGAVIYTAPGKQTLLGLSDEEMAAHRSSTEGHALVLARGIRARLGSTWGFSETGAAGPTGNRYGDAAGHTCFAVSGPAEIVRTLETGSADRAANMEAFAVGALQLLAEALGL